MPLQKPKIKAIIFDLGGVLVHGGYLDFLKHYCQACFTPLGKKEMTLLERKANLGELTETEFYREIKRLFGVHITPKKMHELIVSKMQTDKALMHLLPKLKQTKLALFSNSLGDMAVDVLRLRSIPTKKLFSKVFISSRLHIAKPDAKAYNFVLKKLKVKAGESVMVDDREENIRGARRIGMQGIIYKNSRQFRRELKKYEFA